MPLPSKAAFGAAFLFPGDAGGPGAESLYRLFAIPDRLIDT